MVAFQPNIQYKIEVSLRTIATTCMCLRFKIGNTSSNEQFLVYDKKSSGGFSYINSSLQIWGVANNKNHIDIPLTLTRNEHITLFVEWPGER